MTGVQTVYLAILVLVALGIAGIAIGALVKLAAARR